jgi:hypothetical protein
MLNIREAIGIITRIEDVYSNLTTSQIIDSLRHYGGYDGKSFRTFLGTQNKTTYTLPPSGKLTKGDIDNLALIMKHLCDNVKGTEIGIVSDLSGNELAFGHVICGISGAIHHPKLLYCKIDLKNRTTKICSDTLEGTYRDLRDIDSVAAMTLTGDIGQAGAEDKFYLCSKDRDRSHRGGKWKFGGIGSFASQAELIGDIDGFLLGYWLCTNITVANVKGQLSYRSRMLDYSQSSPNVLKLSTMLSKYYELDPKVTNEMVSGSGYRLASTKSFPSFKTTFKALNDNEKKPNFFRNQSLNFCDVYNGAFSIPSLPKRIEVQDAYQDFELWLANDGKYDFYTYPRAASDYDESDEVAWANVEGIEDCYYELTLTRIDRISGKEEKIAYLIYNKIEGTSLSEPDESTVAFLADVQHSIA